MRRLAAMALAGAILAVAAAAAGAQSVVFVGAGPGGTAASIPVGISGSVTVTFHGDGAAGCASHGLCAYSGVITWQPPRRGTLELLTGPTRHPGVSVSLQGSGGPGGLQGGTTIAHVTLGGPPSTPSWSDCVDVVSSGWAVNFPVRRGRATFSLRDAVPSLLTTRCAGPRDADLTPALPAPALSVAALRRGRATVALSGTRSFSAHGFSDSVTSDLVLHLGRPGRSTPLTTQSPHGAERIRSIDVTYRAAMSGTVSERVSGASNPLLCAPLGSCGLSGTITLSPRVRAQDAHLDAQELAPRALRPLRAAVGLARGSAAGIVARGAAEWAGGGSIDSDLVQGGEHCTDTGALGGGSLSITTRGGRATVAYGAGSLFAGPAASSRCPGPLAPTATAATATVPLAMLRRRTVRLDLTTGSRTTDAGFEIHFMPHLTVTLTRLRTRTTIFRVPAGTPVF